jgi:hypothetical protein
MGADMMIFTRLLCGVTGLFWCIAALTMPEYTGFTVCGLAVGVPTLLAAFI